MLKNIKTAGHQGKCPFWVKKTAYPHGQVTVWHVLPQKFSDWTPAGDS